MTKKLLIFLLLTLVCQQSTADFGWSDSSSYSLDLLDIPAIGNGFSDSPLFPLDLLDIPIAGAGTPSDSPLFALNLSPTNRGWADSDSFFYDDFLILLGDITGDYKVNMEDLEAMVEQWLQSPGEPSADVAPDPLDDFVDLLDFAVIVEDWLVGTEY